MKKVGKGIWWLGETEKDICLTKSSAADHVYHV